MKRRFDKMIKDINESEDVTTQDMTNRSKYSIISKDLEKLINTREKAELPEGFRYVEEGEILPAGDYITRMSVSGKRTMTNAPVRKDATKETEPADTIPENPESSDDVDSPTQDPESRKVEVIDDAKRYSINDFKADLAKVQTMDELQQILADLSIKVSEESVAFEDLQVMSVLAKQKAADIKAGTVKIDPIGLTEGAQVIAKEIIFDNAKMFALTSDTLVVKSVDKTNKTVTLTLMGTTNEMTVGFDKLNEMFILKDTVMDASEPVTEPVTKEEKEMVTQSSDLADAILNNSTELEKLEKSVSNKTVSELDTDLLEDLKC
jgi:VCBS repeat-containing protein